MTAEESWIDSVSVSVPKALVTVYTLADDAAVVLGTYDSAQQLTPSQARDAAALLTRAADRVERRTAEADQLRR